MFDPYASGTERQADAAEHVGKRKMPPGTAAVAERYGRFDEAGNHPFGRPRQDPHRGSIPRGSGDDAFIVTEPEAAAELVAEGGSLSRFFAEDQRVCAEANPHSLLNRRSEEDHVLAANPAHLRKEPYGWVLAEPLRADERVVSGTDNDALTVDAAHAFENVEAFIDQPARRVWRETEMHWARHHVGIGELLHRQQGGKPAGCRNAVVVDKCEPFSRGDAGFEAFVAAREIFRSPEYA